MRLRHSCRHTPPHVSWPHRSSVENPAPSTSPSTSPSTFLLRPCMEDVVGMGPKQCTPLSASSVWGKGQPIIGSVCVLKDVTIADCQKRAQLPELPRAPRRSPERPVLPRGFQRFTGAATRKGGILPIWGKCCRFFEFWVRVFEASGSLQSSPEIHGVSLKAHVVRLYSLFLVFSRCFPEGRHYRKLSKKTFFATPGRLCPERRH